MNKTKRVTLLGLLLAAMMVLSIFEHSLPPLPFLPPQVRLGLANVVSMYAVYFMSGKEAFILNVAKSVFVFLIRGPIAGFLSFSGGVLSILIVIVLSHFNFSYVFVSIISAITHNVGQIIMASFLLGSNMVKYYLPILILSGIFLGSVTGVLLQVVMPVFNRIFDTEEK